MKYDKNQAKTVLLNYFDEKYDLKEKQYSAVITFGEEVYFLELCYNDIWYSISDKYPIIIQEKKRDGSFLYKGTDIGLTKDEYFNFSMMENPLDIVLMDNVKELTDFVYEVLIPSVRSQDYD